jgi:hypothetical protein
VTRLGALVVAALLTCASLAACTSETIVLATVEVDDAGTSGHASMRCTTSNDCGGGLYCEKTSCGATVGTCELPPPDCDGPMSLSCGCDGVTYFNECLRRASGIAPLAPGSCPFEAAALCGGDTGLTCPAGAACAHLLGFVHGPSCPSGVSGSCWMLPARCPAPEPSGDAWDACDGTAQCASRCDAVRASDHTGVAYRRAQSCP